MKRLNEEIRKRGIRIRIINIVVVALSCVISLLLVRSIWQAEKLIEEKAGLAPEEFETLLALSQRQEIYTGLLLAVILLSILSVVVLVLGPMDEYIGQIRKHQILPMRGAYELRYLAKAYNRVLEENQQHSEHLLYQAEHDPLTGLFNRGAFEKLRESHGGDHVGLMLIDVDKFKSVNDDYGHETGDRVLKKVADLLSTGFRASDYPCRIGGDEFAVIMTDMSPGVKTAVRTKMRSIREGLQDVAEDGLPKVTLSVGVAFSDQCGPGEDLYKLADAALYVVKERGRDGCAFYGDK